MLKNNKYNASRIFFFFFPLKRKTGESSIVALLTKTMFMASGPRLVKSRLKQNKNILESRAV